MTFQILILFLLILANALFAMAELAFVSTRKTRLQKLATMGNRNAQLALDLASDPSRFLSIVQVGISLVGIVAGAYGGASLAEPLSQYFLQIPWISHSVANALSITIVVTGIFFFSLVFGELIPKRIALAFPDFLALRLAIPMTFFAKIANPAISALRYITDTSLSVLGIRPQNDASVSDEDVKDLIDEGIASGAMHVVEKKMVEGVLSLDQLTVEDIMTPRARVVWLNISDSDEVNWRKIVASGHSNFPVYKDNRDTVLGMVAIKSLWANLSLAQTVDLKSLVIDPLFVPASMTANKFLETLKRERTHIALVSDEFGGLIGIVTLNDLFEHIVGELPSGDQPRKSTARKREDGSWLVDAILAVDEFRAAVPVGELPGEKDGAYETIGGFVIHRLGRIPDEADHFDFDGFRFEVLDMDRHRIDKILVTPLPPAEPHDSSETSEETP